MRRLRGFLMVLVLAAAVAACGGDDDDDGGSASGSASVDEEATDEDGGDGEAAASGDFCEIWPSLNSGDIELAEGEAPTEEQIAEARRLVEDARASAPSEIEDDVDQFVDVVEGLLDVFAEGEEPDEETFGQLFALAFEVGPRIEEWLVENCEGYESENAFGGGASGSEFTADDFGDGLLGLTGDDAANLLNEVFPAGHYGYSSSGDESTLDYEVTVDMTADEALAACETFSQALSSHPDLTGTLTLRIRQYVDADDPDTEEVELGFGEGEIVVDNAGISAGDPGTCEAA